MTPAEARKMVEKLSYGLDPFIGRKLPPEDVCSEVEIQEALRIVLDYCTIESNDQIRARKKADIIVARELRVQERYVRYPNTGKPWTSDEITSLLNLYHKGYNTYQIATVIKRTPSAINSQLKQHSLSFIRKK